MQNDRECVDAVRWALELGYRHVDTAQAYGNEGSVGQGLRESGVPRGEVFITTKFLPGRKDPVTEAQRSLQRLGVDYVDLYLIHWPEGGPTWAWPGMEQARELGYARSIGVSNFGAGEVRQLLATTTVPPVVNQVQFSANEYRKALLDTCRQNGIALEAYSPLGTGRHLASDTVARIARRRARTPAQVLLRWSIERAVPVIPKSTHRERIAENAQLFDFRLSEEDVAELDALDRTGGTDRALERKWWGANPTDLGPILNCLVPVPLVQAWARQVNHAIKQLLQQGINEGPPGMIRGGKDIAPSEGTRPMADDEQSMVSGLVQDFIAQLRAVTGGLEDLAGLGARRPLAPGTFPLPGALSAAQLTAIAGSVAAQRRSIEALKAQLSSFDEQLAVLEQILGPLTEWSRTWAEVEHRLLNMSGGPAAESSDNSLRSAGPGFVVMGLPGRERG